MHVQDNIAEANILEYAGSFRLLRKIAVGGMATVYEAEQLGPEGFAKRVALKVIHPRYAKESTWLQLFIDEAKLSANLVHGNIVIWDSNQICYPFMTESPRGGLWVLLLKGLLAI